MFVGEFVCDDGVGRDLGDAADEWEWIGGGKGLMAGSILGAMLEPDLLDWCLFIMARCIGGGCTRFWGT
jgi:hypothetical protein